LPRPMMETLGCIPDGTLKLSGTLATKERHGEKSSE
jgi:hypothetical protein